jgi:hypothetical protein
MLGERILANSLEESGHDAAGAFRLAGQLLKGLLN